MTKKESKRATGEGGEGRAGENCKEGVEHATLLLLVVISWMYKHIKHQNIHLKYVKFCVCQLRFNLFKNNWCNFFDSGLMQKQESELCKGSKIQSWR